MGEVGYHLNSSMYSIHSISCKDAQAYTVLLQDYLILFVGIRVRFGAPS